MMPNDVLDPSIYGASGRKGKWTGKWTAVEDSKLKDAVQTHGDKLQQHFNNLVLLSLL
jgi:hypothetical protein